MQILHFNWLRYWRAFSNSPQVAKFAGFSLDKFPFKKALLSYPRGGPSRFSTVQSTPGRALSISVRL